jgi:hypothetical protein
MAQTRSERLNKQKELSRRRRKKIRSNPKLLAEENRKRRERYASQKKEREAKKKRMTDREIRTQRRKWRNTKRKQKSKNEHPASKDKIGVESRQMLQGKKRAARTRERYRSRILKLTEDNRKLRLQKNMYKVRLHRLMIKSMSPRAKLRQEMKGEKLSPAARKRLLFGCALEEDLKSTWSSIKSRKERRLYMETLKLKYIVKYRFMSTAKPFFPISEYTGVQKRRVVGAKKRAFLGIKYSVQEFFEQDDVSILAPGKKDCITQKGRKKQKRYLCNSMKFLHRKYCDESNVVISYSAFCKLRPFWVIDKKLNERDTCLCKKCENVILLHAALKREKIVDDDLTSLIEKGKCCIKPDENCYFQKCSVCLEKEIVMNEFDDTTTVNYDTWEPVRELHSNGRTYVRRIVKKRISCKRHEMVDKFFLYLPEYMNHVGRIRHQYRTLKTLRSNLTTNEIYIHIDFSENYLCKYNREIQSCHFGANRQQLTLHTGIVYPEKSSFCTISEDLHHDATAIWAHLMPVLSKYVTATSVHFVSDSPSSQYRNKAMIHIIFFKIIPLFPLLEVFSWNYLEAGHGKGPADGVGGVIKRTCDRSVLLNGDVSNFTQFKTCIKEKITNIQIMDAADRDPVVEHDVALAMPVEGK